MRKIKFELEKNNPNALIIKQLKNGNNFNKTIAIPPGLNRTDIITYSKIEDGYNYNIDAIIIITNDKIRKIYCENELHIEYNLITKQYLSIIC